MPEVLENIHENLTPRMRNLMAMLWSEWKDLELQIAEMNDEVERIASSDDACRRLRQIPGIGPLVATASLLTIQYVVFGTSSFWSVLAIRRVCDASTNRPLENQGQASRREPRLRRSSLLRK